MFARLTFAFLAAATMAIPVVPASAESDVYVYVADQPGLCILDPYAYDGQVIGVFVHSGDCSNVTAARFRIESERFGPEHVQSVTTPDGMTVSDGDIFTGITVTFTGRSLDHQPILYVELAGHESEGDAWTREVAIMRAGAWEPVPDFGSFGYPFDCFSIVAWWFPPDTVDVWVNKDETFSFKALVVMGGFPHNGMVYAVDANGWIPDPVEESVWAGCGHCPWDFTVITVPVHVPGGIADGTLNPVTFEMLSFGSPIDEKTVVLRAVNPIATEEATWGRVKALYR